MKRSRLLEQFNKVNFTIRCLYNEDIMKMIFLKFEQHFLLENTLCNKFNYYI